MVNVLYRHCLGNKAAVVTHNNAYSGCVPRPLDLNVRHPSLAVGRVAFLYLACFGRNLPGHAVVRAARVERS